MTVDIELYGALPISLNFRALEAEWSRDKGDLRKEVKLKLDAPQKAIGAAVSLVRKVKESLELRIEDDGALSVQWHSFEATPALPEGVTSVDLHLPRVAYDVEADGGNTGVVAFRRRRPPLLPRADALGFRTFGSRLRPCRAWYLGVRD